MNITFLGYYGYGSLGDDIVLSMLIDDIKRTYPCANITVLASAPDKAEASYKAPCIHRYNIPAIIKLLSQTDLFILGGGTLIQDTTSKRSLIYYTEMITLAKQLGAAVYLMGGGIGELRHTDCASRALRLCDRISVRDVRSKRILDRFGIDCTLSCDRFLSANAPERRNGGGYFTVSVRECASDTALDSNALSSSLSSFSDVLTPVFVSMQDSYDLKLCRHLAKKLGGVAVSPKSLDELLYLQAGAEFAVGMRLHFLLSAMLCSLPTVALSYDVKTNALGIPTFPCDSFDVRSLTAAIKNAAPAHVPENCKSLCRADTRSVGELILKSKKFEFNRGA